MTNELTRLKELARRLRDGRDEDHAVYIATEVGLTTQLSLDASEAILSLITRLEMMQSEIDEANLKIAQQHNRIKRARNEALEEAARACDFEEPTWDRITGNPCRRLAATIRALKTTPAT